MNKLTKGDKSFKLVALTHIRAIYERGSLGHADLVFSTAGYEIQLHTDQDVLVVARRGGDQPRGWRSVDRALVFIQREFGFVKHICLIHPPEGEAKCKSKAAPRKQTAKAKAR